MLETNVTESKQLAQQHIQQATSRILQLIQKDRMRVYPIAIEEQGKTEPSQHSKEISLISADLSRLRITEKKRKRRLAILLHKLEEQKQLKQNEQQRVLQEQRSKKLQQKRRDLEESIQKIKRRQQERLSSIRRGNYNYNRVKKKLFMHQLIQQRFIDEKMLPEIQQRKQKIQDIRRRAHNFSLVEIQKHEAAYLSKKQQESKSISIMHSDYVPPRQKAVRTRALMQKQERQARQQQEMRVRKADQNRKKRKDFAQFLRERMKKMPEKQAKDILKANKSQQLKRPTQSQIKEQGNSFLQQAKKMRKKIIDQKKPIQSTRPKKKDYLQDLKKDQSKQKNILTKKKRREMESLLAMPNGQQKMQALREQEQKLSAVWQHKNKILNQGQCTNRQQMQEQLAELLFLSVKVKGCIVQMLN